MKDRATYVDWPRLLSELQYLLGDFEWEGSAVRIPVGTPTLAKHLGWSRGKVMNVLDGTKVEYHEGLSLIELWCSLTGKSQAFLPITVRTMSASAMKEKA